MSNEKFNEVDLGLYAFDQFKGILARNDFGKMLDLMHPLTEKLATSFGELINNLPDIFSGFAAGATGQSKQQGGSSVGSFTGGLPAVDSGIGDLFTALAESIRTITGFAKGGGNPAAEFQAIIKEKKQKNKSNQSKSQETLRLMAEVQQRNIDNFQEKLKSETDAKKQLRKKIEDHAQRIGQWLQYLKNLGPNPQQKRKGNYALFLKNHALQTQKYNQAAAQFNKLYENIFPIRKNYKR